MRAAANAEDLRGALDRAYAVRPERAIIALGRVDASRWEEAEGAIRVSARSLEILDFAQLHSRAQEKLSEVRKVFVLKS